MRQAALNGNPRGKSRGACVATRLRSGGVRGGAAVTHDRGALPPYDDNPSDKIGTLGDGRRCKSAIVMDV